MVNGTTRIVAIVGTPISQVKSPENFNALFARDGINMVMIPVDMAHSGISSFVEAVRNWHNCDGFVVTVPHKQAFSEHVDILSERASVLGAVNVVRRHPDGVLRGDMVDGLGCLEAARAHGFEAAGSTAFVVGTGGAGSAIAYALCEAGARQVHLHALNVERLEALAELLAESFPDTTISTEIPKADTLDYLMNATPLGMNEDDPLPVSTEFLDGLKPNILVGDVVTVPALTPFLAAAQVRGHRIQMGPEMAKGQVTLLGQAMGIIEED